MTEMQSDNGGARCRHRGETTHVWGGLVLKASKRRQHLSRNIRDEAKLVGRVQTGCYLLSAYARSGPTLVLLPVYLSHNHPVR